MTTAIFLRRLFMLLGGLVIITLAVLEVLAARLAPPSAPWTSDVRRSDYARDWSECEPDPSWPSPEGVSDVVASTPISQPVAVPH